MMLLPLFVLLLMATPAFAQSGPGLWQAAPGTGISQCINIGTPVTNRTWCFDGNNNPNYTIKVWDGTQYVNIVGGGGGAPVDAFYVLTKANASLPNAVNLNLLPSSLLLNNPVGFTVDPYAGSACAPGFAVTSISATGAVTCVPPTGLSALGGKVQLCNTTTTAVITFSSPVADANYPVTLGTQPDTGTPPHVIADYNTPTVNGFNLTISDQPGAGNCVQVSWAAGTASTGGGGGVPGGVNKNVQFNDSGVFGGATLSWDKVLNLLDATNNVTNIGTALNPFQQLFLSGLSNTFASSPQLPALVLSSWQEGSTAANLANILGNLGVLPQIVQFAQAGSSGTNFRGNYKIFNLTSSAEQSVIGFHTFAGTYATPAALVAGDHIGNIEWSGGLDSGSSPSRLYARLLTDVATDTTRGRFVINMGGPGFTFYNNFFSLAAGVTFTNLPGSGDGSSNGTMVYCTDCDPTATLLACTHVGAQTGAFAYRVNGAWKCMG